LTPQQKMAQLMAEISPEGPSVPTLTYHQRGVLSLMVFEAASIDDLRRAQNFLQALVAHKELEAHAATWQQRQQTT